MTDYVTWERPFSLTAIRNGAAAGWGDLEPDEDSALFDPEPLRFFRVYAAGYAEAQEFLAKHHSALTDPAKLALQQFLQGELLTESREATAFRKHFVPSIPEEILIEGRELGPPERGALDPIWSLAQIEGHASHPMPQSLSTAYRAKSSVYVSTVVRPQAAYTGGPNREALELTSHCVWVTDAIPLYVYSQRQVPIDEARLLSKSGKRQRSGSLDPASSSALIQAFWPERLQQGNMTCSSLDPKS